MTLAGAGALVISFAVLLPRSFLVNDDEILIPFFRENVLAPFVSPVLSQALSATYAWAPAIPWFGLWLYLMHTVALALVTLALLDCVKGSGPGLRTAATLSILATVIAFGPLSWRISFTPAAISACGAALLAFCTGLLGSIKGSDGRSADREGFLVRALACGCALAAGFATRREALAAAGIVLFPLLAVAGARVLRGSSPRGNWGTVVFLPALAVLLAPSLMLVAMAPAMPQTRDPAARAFLRYNLERGRLHAHAAYVGLAKQPDVLKEAGWTVGRYRAFDHWLFLDEQWYSLERLQRLHDTGGHPRQVTLSFFVEAVALAYYKAGYGGTLLLASILIALGLGSAGLLGQRSALLAMGHVVLLVALAVAMQRTMRFPEHIALPLSLLAGAAVWRSLLVGTVEDRQSKPADYRSWREASVVSLATFLLAGGALVATAKRLATMLPRPEPACELFEARLAEQQPSLVVAHEGAGCRRDPMRPDPRPYPTVILGWTIFSPPFYSGIARVGARRADELLSALAADPKGYVLARRNSLAAVRAAFRTRAPEVDLEEVDAVDNLVLLRPAARPPDSKS